MADLLQFLKQKHIGEVLTLASKIIETKTDTSAYDGFMLIAENNILSVPLYDSKENGYTAFLDILDILYYLSTEDLKNNTFTEKLQKKTCGELADYSKLDPFIKVTDTSNLIQVLQISSQDYRSLHRFPVVDSQGKLKGIVSQSLLVRFLEPHTKKFDFGTLQVGVLGLGIDKQVITISEDSSLSAAIRKLRESKVSGIGVIDHTGKLVGNFGATALKFLGLKVIDSINITLKDFLHQKPDTKEESTIVVTKQTTAHQVITKFTTSGVHRIFVVDEKGHPIGIISLGDIIELFFRHILIE